MKMLREDEIEENPHLNKKNNSQQEFPPQGIILIDSGGRTKYANLEACRLLGVSCSSMIGDKTSDILMKKLNVALKEVRERGSYEATCRESSQVLSLAFTKLDSEGIDFASVLSIRDVTNDRANRERLSHIAHQVVCLRNVTRLLSDLLKPISQTLQSFAHLILEGWRFPDYAMSRISFGNNTFQSAGFAESKHRLESCFAPEKDMEVVLEIFYSEGVPIAGDDPFNEGERILIDTLATELGQYIQRKTGQRIREQQHVELEIYSSLLRHDLKNDLGIILGNVDFLKMVVGEDDSELKEIIASTEAVSSRMNRLLTAFSKSREVVKQDITTMVSSVANNAERIHTGIKIHVESTCRARNLFIVESRLLPLVFENLFRNCAIHAGRDCQIDVSITSDNENIIIIVSDDGPGVADEVKDSLFQKGASTRGGGLGLYLSRKVVNSLGGMMENIEPKGAEGAVFKITLPLNM